MFSNDAGNIAEKKTNKDGISTSGVNLTEKKAFSAEI